MADQSKSSSRSRKLSTSMKERIRIYEASSSSGEALVTNTRPLEAADTLPRRQRAATKATGVTRATDTTPADQEYENHMSGGRKVSKFMRNLLNHYEDTTTSPLPQSPKTSSPTSRGNKTVTRSPLDKRVTEQLTVTPIKRTVVRTPSREVQPRPSEQALVTTVTETATAEVPELVQIDGETTKRLDIEHLQVDDTELALTKANEELDESQRIIEEQVWTISELELKIHDLEIRNESLKSKVKGHQAEVDQLEREHIVIVGSLAQQSELASELQRQMEELECSKSEKEAELADAKTYIQNLLDREEQLEAALVELTNVMDKLESNVINLIGEVEGQSVSRRSDVVHTKKDESKVQVNFNENHMIMPYHAAIDSLMFKTIMS